jgi:hypothetical protein
MNPQAVSSPQEVLAGLVEWVTYHNVDERRTGPRE